MPIALSLCTVRRISVAGMELRAHLIQTASATTLYATFSTARKSLVLSIRTAQEMTCKCPNGELQHGLVTKINSAVISGTAPSPWMLTLVVKTIVIV